MNLLFEIGLEDLPSSFVLLASEQLQTLAVKEFNAARLWQNETKIHVWGTPRRLALFLDNVRSEQEALTSKIKGPNYKAAYDNEGNPTKALLGFCRSRGISPAEVQKEDEYVYAYIEEKSLSLLEAAAEILPRLLVGLSFPRTMRWGSSDFRYARPLRWLLAITDVGIIPMEINGVVSGSLTYGHRFLSPSAIEILNPIDYEAALRKANVLVDREKRRKQILEKGDALAHEAHFEVQWSDSLLAEVTDLTEWPQPFLGSFPEKTLHLPKELLITSMAVHQRYFPVTHADGRLAARFLGVANAGVMDVVRAGNEKVLKARLEDAEFFYAQDIKEGIRAQIERLIHVSEHQKLGSLGDKTKRLQKLSELLASELALPSDVSIELLRAAELSKFDLVTAMVGEFPELQGIMAGEYAKVAGESEGVATALREQYLPSGSQSPLPATIVGSVLALVEKVDTITGAFLIGHEPTASQDPYGVRRAGNGVVRLLVEKNLHLRLSILFAASLTTFSSQEEVPPRSMPTAILKFFRGRLETYLLDQGASVQEAGAILAAGYDEPYLLKARLFAVQKLLEATYFTDFLIAYRRAANLASKKTPASVHPERLELDAERRLYTALQEAQADLAGRQQEYAFVLERAALMRPYLDAFFADVMVMVEDEALRTNRLALLQGVVELVSHIADFSLFSFAMATEGS